MKHQLDHPYHHHQRNVPHYPHPVYPIHRSIPARPFLSPSPHPQTLPQLHTIPHYQSLPLHQPILQTQTRTIPAHSQRKYSLSNEPLSPSSIQNYNPQAPAFRQLRQRYIKSNSTPFIEERQSETMLVKAGPQVKQEKPSKKAEEVKYDELKTTCNSSEIVYVDKKLNVTHTSGAKGDKVKPTNDRIECIIEQLPYLQESKALFSQINHFKKKLNDLEDQNHRLKAELFNQQVKNSTDLEKHREQEQRLTEEIKSLRIQLQKNQNECLMCRINQVQMQKKCRQLSQRSQEQQAEIARLKELVLWKQEEPESTQKSETTYL